MTSGRYSGLIVTLVVIFFAANACLATSTSEVTSPDDPCASVSTQTTSPGTEDVTEISIWARGYGEHCWRLYGPVKAAETMTDYSISVMARSLEMSPGAHKDLFSQAAESGTAPDITMADMSDLKRWAEAGYIVPLDECRSRYAAFADIPDRIWSTASWNGQVWGVPVEVGLLLFYFNKQKLSRLGWSDEDIAALPQAIQAGDFTLDDMLLTIREATETGLIKPGFGYWPKLDEQSSFLLYYAAHGGKLSEPERGVLVVNRSPLEKTYDFQRRLITEKVMLEAFEEGEALPWADPFLWNDAIAHGRVLFFSASNIDQTAWAVEFADSITEREQLAELIGYAAFPANVPEGDGQTLWWQTNFYVITSEQASGRRHQEAACALLARTVTAEINAHNAKTSGYQGVLRSELLAPWVADNSFNSTVLPLRDSAWLPPLQHERYEDMIQILLEFSDQAERGEQSPEVAARQAIRQLENELGAMLVVE